MLTSGSYSMNTQKIIFNRRLRKDNDRLTYVIGFRAKDGIAIVADRKITRASGSVSYEPKIFNDVENVLIAAAGPVGLFDKFRTEIFPKSQEKLDEYRDDPQKLVKDAEKLVYQLNEEYFDRIRSPIEVLIALGQKVYPDLQHITANGVGQRVRYYQAIGSGEPYGSFFLKMSYSEELNMYQCGALGYFIIKMIEDKALDNAVGIEKESDPDIWIMPIAPDNYSELSPEERTKYDHKKLTGGELDHIRKIISNEYLKFDKYFKNDFSNLFHQVQ